MDWKLVKTYVIFNMETKEEVARVPFLIDDGDHGLPGWYFGLKEDGSYGPAIYDALETDDAGTWGWTPGMGPAPCWTAKADSFAEAVKLNEEWLMDNF